MSSYLPNPKSKQPKPQPSAPREQPRVTEPTPPPAVPASAGGAGTRRLPEWAQGILLTLSLVILILAGAVVFSLVQGFVASGGTSIGVFQPAPVVNTPESGITPTMPILVGPAYKPWNGVDRVTVLAMGLDMRDVGPEAGQPARTDTMILISMDPITKTAGMLSIPRDLYVDIPGFGFDKINKAYFDAEVNRLPGGGPALAMQTVENLLGMPIDYYAVLDFTSFTNFVDTIGGIDVYVPFDNMVVDPLGNGNTKLLFFGKNHLTGPEALGFARNRKTEGGDMDRAARTQQVILAIRDKILSFNMIPILLTKAPTLYSETQSGIRTNLSLDQMISLAMVAKDIRKTNIHQGVIDNSDLLAMDTINNEAILLPNLEKVRELRDTVFTQIGPLGYTVPPTDLDPLAFQENAKIEILNGSGRNGLASTTKDYLVAQGFSADNITTGTAESQVPTSQLYDLSGMPYTIRYLSNLMNIGSENINSQVSFGTGADIQLILGADWNVPE